jgi:glycosyltransferase involved in cell wall biosynthesis
MGVFYNKITKTPHLYDMHSSLVQQMENFQFTRSKIITGFFKWIEKISLRNASSIIVICRSLYDYAAQITCKEKLTIIENFIDDIPNQMDKDKLEQVKKEIGSSEKKIIMYTGTLEAYQGIPLLIESMTHLDGDFRLVLIGGKQDQLEAMAKTAKEKRLENRVLLLGSKQPEEIPYYLKVSDVLVSPRTLGTNTPLKIYSYLKSGVPVVATNLYTHTQSINKNISILVEPEPEAFAKGIREAVSEKGKTISKNAVTFCKKNYSHEKYLELVTEALEKVSRA